MNYDNKKTLALGLLKTKIGLVLLTPLLAWGAGEAAPIAGSIDGITGTTWAFILAFSMLGWTVSDLDKLAEWFNIEGKTSLQIWTARLNFLKTIAASNAAGAGTFFIGKSAPGVLLSAMGIPAVAAPQFPEMVIFVAITGAGYMGARWFAWFEGRFFVSRNGIPPKGGTQ